MTSTGFTCPCCHETICADVRVDGQTREPDGTVQLHLQVEFTGDARAHIESHRP